MSTTTFPGSRKGALIVACSPQKTGRSSDSRVFELAVDPDDVFSIDHAERSAEPLLSQRQRNGERGSDSPDCFW